MTYFITSWGSLSVFAASCLNISFLQWLLHNFVFFFLLLPPLPHFTPTAAASPKARCCISRVYLQCGFLKTEKWALNTSRKSFEPGPAGLRCLSLCVQMMWHRLPERKSRFFFLLIHVYSPRGGTVSQWLQPFSLSSDLQSSPCLLIHQCCDCSSSSVPFFFESGRKLSWLRAWHTRSVVRRRTSTILLFYSVDLFLSLTKLHMLVSVRVILNEDSDSFQKSGFNNSWGLHCDLSIPETHTLNHNGSKIKVFCSNVCFPHFGLGSLLKSSIPHGVMSM